MSSWIVETKGPAVESLQQIGMRNYNAPKFTLSTQRPTLANGLWEFSTGFFNPKRIVKIAEDAIVVNDRDLLRSSPGQKRIVGNERVELRLPSVDAPGGATDIAEEQSWPISLWKIDEFWKKGLTGKGIRVGIVDSGLDAQHPIFSSLSRLKSIQAFAQFDSEGKSLSEFSQPNSEDITKQVTYGHWHGSHCASILAGDARSAQPSGVAPEISLYVARALDENNEGTVASIYAALSWLLTFKCDIISLSLGWHGYRDHWAAPISHLLAQGAVIVAASGNEYGQQSLGWTRSPANYPQVDSLGKLISVGAVDRGDTVWQLSGGDRVKWPSTYEEGGGHVRPTIFANSPEFIVPTIVGPGVAIPGAHPGGSYRLATGTSAAAPFIAGILALLLQHFRKKDTQCLPAVAAKLLLESTRDIAPPGSDTRTGLGIPDTAQLLAFLNR